MVQHVHLHCQAPCEKEIPLGRWCAVIGRWKGYKPETRGERRKMVRKYSFALTGTICGLIKECNGDLRVGSQSMSCDQNPKSRLALAEKLD